MKVTNPEVKMWVMEFDGLAVLTTHFRKSPWAISHGNRKNFEHIVWDYEDIMEEFGISTLDFNDPKYCPSPKMSTRLAERCLNGKGIVSQEVPFVSFIYPYSAGPFDRLMYLGHNSNSRMSYVELVRSRENAIKAMKGRRI